MLLAADGVPEGRSASVMIVSLLRQLGLLADPTDMAATDEAVGHPVALLFGATAITLTIGERSSAVMTGDIGDPVLSPIWQGVPASSVNAVAMWLRLDIAITRDDDRTLLAQRLCALSALLAARLPVTSLCWLPNQLWSDARLLADAVIAVERQGLPPVMHLVGFIPATDGSVATRGLDWFGLQDMRISAPGGMAAADLVRCLARLAAEQLAVRAPLRRGRYPGIARGDWVSIEPADPSAGRQLCEVLIEPLQRR